MLSEEEELRLQNIIENIGTEGTPDITQIKWLAENLKMYHEKFKYINSNSSAFESREDRLEFNQAKDLLMKSHNLTEQQAYKFMLKISVDERIKKIEVARRILKELNP